MIQGTYTTELSPPSKSKELPPPSLSRTETAGEPKEPLISKVKTNVTTKAEHQNKTGSSKTLDTDLPESEVQGQMKSPDERSSSSKPEGHLASISLPSKNLSTATWISGLKTRIGEGQFHLSTHDHGTKYPVRKPSSVVNKSSYTSQECNSREKTDSRERTDIREKTHIDKVGSEHMKNVDLGTSAGSIAKDLKALQTARLVGDLINIMGVQIGDLINVSGGIGLSYLNVSLLIISPETLYPYHMFSCYHISEIHYISLNIFFVCY